MSVAAGGWHSLALMGKSVCIQYIPVLMGKSVGAFDLNLNPLNLVRWIDSWPFDKPWKPGRNDSMWVYRFNGQAMNLEWIFIVTPSRARKPFSKVSPCFFLQHLYEPSAVTTGIDSMPFDYFAWFQKIQLNAERDSLDESSAFLRGAWRDRDTNDIFAHCSLIFYFIDFKFSNIVCPSELHPLMWFF